MFKITRGRGFQMTFANGWTVSVQFGPDNYCENRSMLFDTAEGRARADILAGEQGCKNAEIAAWDTDGNWHNFGGDTVEGWCKPDAVAEFIHFISTK